MSMAIEVGNDKFPKMGRNVGMDHCQWLMDNEGVIQKEFLFAEPGPAIGKFFGDFSVFLEIFRV